MVGSRMTFVAEFVDRLTGPSTKAKKAVEDLGKAAADAAKKSEQANRRAEGADQKRASSSRRAAEDVRRSEGRKATAAAGSATAADRASRTVDGAERRRQRASRDTATVAGRSAGQQRRASQTTAQAIQNHGRRINTTLGGTRSASSRTADAIQQMAGRSNRAVSGMQRGMDRINPGRMATRYNSALGRMLSRTEQVSGKIQGHLDKISSSGAVRGAQVGATVVGGMALAGGAKRIADVQQADVVMETMGLNEQDRGELIGQYKGLAQNTPYSTGSISMLGSGLLSAGMSQDDLQGALKGAIDTGALYGMNLEDIGLPLKQIQAKGKLQGDDVNQLVDRGIPIYKWIAEQKGVDQSKVPDLVTKGQVTSDDVFKALAKNSEGGAEKAAGTLKGSWTNFLSSISQGGEAFLTPLVGPLTDLLKGAKDTITTMKPALSILGEFTAVIVKGITPALPVLIPLVVALGGGLLALAAAAKAALVIRSVATGLGLIRSFLGGRGRGRGATGAVGLFTEFLGGMRDGAREAYGQRGLGGLNAGLDTSTKKMGKAQGAAKGFKRTLGGLAGMAGAFGGGTLGGAVGGGTGNTGIIAGGGGGKEGAGKAKGGKLGALKNFGAGALGFLGGPLGIAALGATVGAAVINERDPLNGVDPDAVSKAIESGDAGALNGLMKDAQWANGNGGFMNSLNHGKISGVNGVGDVASYLDSEGWGRKTMDGITGFFGSDTATSQAKSTLSDIDASLAGLVAAGKTQSAGSQFNQIVFQAEAKGSSQQDIMGMFPSYKQAVQSALSQKGQASDDNAVLAAMRSDRGFRSGGFTGMGPASGVAGVVHGREYVMPESVTSRPGMLPALRQIHRTGEVPRTYHGDTTSVQVNVDAAGATVEAAQAVGQSVEEAVARVLARRERRASNRHGTRELRGAN